MFWAHLVFYPTHLLDRGILVPLLEEKNDSQKGKKELAMPPQSEYWEVVHSLNALTIWTWKHMWWGKIGLQ